MLNRNYALRQSRFAFAQKLLLNGRAMLEKWIFFIVIQISYLFYFGFWCCVFGFGLVLLGCVSMCVCLFVCDVCLCVYLCNAFLRRVPVPAIFPPTLFLNILVFCVFSVFHCFCSRDHSVFDMEWFLYGGAFRFYSHWYYKLNRNIFMASIMFVLSSMRDYKNKKDKNQERPIQ